MCLITRCTFELVTGLPKITALRYPEQFKHHSRLSDSDRQGMVLKLCWCVFCSLRLVSVLQDVGGSRSARRRRTEYAGVVVHAYWKTSAYGVRRRRLLRMAFQFPIHTCCETSARVLQHVGVRGTPTSLRTHACGVSRILPWPRLRVSFVFAVGREAR